MDNILIATDGSPSAEEAVEFGLELAAEQGASVTFVHAVPPDEFFIGGKTAFPKGHEEPVDESDTALNAAAAAAKKAGVTYKVERFADLTVDAILEVATKENADLIVVGSHDRASIGTLLGSVSRGLVKKAERPVLVVKGARSPAAT